MNKKTVEMLASLVFLALGSMMIVSSMEMIPRIADDVGSGFIPRLVGIGFVILSVCKLGFALRIQNAEKIMTKATFGKGLLTMVIFSAYVFSFKHLGFIISTFLYMILQITVFKWEGRGIEKGLISTIIISIIIPAVVYVLFSNILNLMLPVGLLG